MYELEAPYPYKWPDGTVGTPGVAFSSDPDTGLYLISDGIVGVATAGVERIRIQSSQVIFNEDGLDTDFRVESLNNANALEVDASLDTVSIGGPGGIDGSVLSITPGAVTRTAITSVGVGVHVPADVVNFDNASSTVAVFALHFLGIPTVDGDNATLTFTDMATLYIEGAPVDNTNVTATNTVLSLWVDAGLVRLDGNLLLSGSGSVLDFNGDVTLTHSTNVLTLGGGDLLVANTFGIVVGHTAKVSFGAEIPELQVLGDAGPDSALALGRFKNDANAPTLKFGKSRGASVGAFAILNNNDALGFTDYVASDDGDMATLVIRVAGEVDDGTPASSDIGAAYVISVAPGGGGGGIAEAFRIAANGNPSFSGMPSGAVTNIGHSGNVITIDTSSREFKRDEKPAKNTDRIYKLTAKDFMWDNTTITPGRSETGLIAEDVYAVIPEAVMLEKPMRKKVSKGDDGIESATWEEYGTAKPASIRQPVIMAMLVDQIQVLRAELTALQS